MILRFSCHISHFIHTWDLNLPAQVNEHGWEGLEIGGEMMEKREQSGKKEEGEKGAL